MIKLLASLACAVTLSACAVSDSAPQAVAADTAASTEKRFDYESTTGSRLPPRKTHERLVKSTEGAEHRKDNPTQSYGNTLNGSIK